ncbi:hypothetical protein MMC22_002997 [Lobaria immixta]|nr:hypothetical protein [Lobaria immixta]
MTLPPSTCCKVHRKRYAHATFAADWNIHPEKRVVDDASAAEWAADYDEKHDIDRTYAHEDDPLTATKEQSDQREKSTVVERRIQSINDVSEDEWLAIKRAEEAKKRTQTVKAGSKDKLFVTKHAKEAKKRLQTVASVLKPKSRFSMRESRGLSASRL